MEIDAESIGHDLLFGTSRFEKDAAPVTAVSASQDVGSAWTESDSSASWAVPGADERETALVGTDLGSDGADSFEAGDPPF